MFRVFVFTCTNRSDDFASHASLQSGQFYRSSESKPAQRFINKSHRPIIILSRLYKNKRDKMYHNLPVIHGTQSEHTGGESLKLWVKKYVTRPTDNCIYPNYTNSNVSQRKYCQLSDIKIHICLEKRLCVHVCVYIPMDIMHVHRFYVFVYMHTYAENARLWNALFLLSLW